MIVWGSHLQVPNGFGCGLGAVQLILYAIYRNHKGEPSKAVADDDAAAIEKAVAAREKSDHGLQLKPIKADDGQV